MANNNYNSWSEWLQDDPEGLREYLAQLIMREEEIAQSDGEETICGSKMDN